MGVKAQSESIPLQWRLLAQPQSINPHVTAFIYVLWDLNTDPDNPQQYPPKKEKKTDTRRVKIEESAVGETVSDIIVSYLSGTLQPLWARKQGEAGISLSKLTTGHKYNPCVALLQPGLCQWCRNFIGLSASSLVWFPNLPTVHATLWQTVMALPYIILWNQKVQFQLAEPHPKQQHTGHCVWLLCSEFQTFRFSQWASKYYHNTHRMGYNTHWWWRNSDNKLCNLYTFLWKTTLSFKYVVSYAIA